MPYFLADEAENRDDYEKNCSEYKFYQEYRLFGERLRCYIDDEKIVSFNVVEHKGIHPNIKEKTDEINGLTGWNE